MKKSGLIGQKIVAYSMAILLVFHLFFGNIERSLVFAQGTEEESSMENVESGCTVEVDAAISQSAVVVTYSVDETVVGTTYQVYRRVTDVYGIVVTEGIVQLVKDEETSVSELSETYSREEIEDEEHTYSVQDGNYTIVYYLQDNTGVAITEEKTVSFVIDSIPPLVVLNCEDEDGMATDSVVCKLTVTDASFQSDAVHVYVKRKPVLGDEETTVLENVSFENGVTQELPFEEEGSYTIYAQVSDQAGNSATTENVTFTIDRTAPVAAIDAGEFTSGKTYSTKMNPMVLTLKMSDLNLVEDFCEVRVEKDGRKLDGIDCTWEGDTEKTATLTFDEQFEDGYYAIRLTAMDVMNQSSVDEFAFFIDNTEISIESLEVGYDKFTIDPPTAVIEDGITTYYLKDSAKVTATVKEQNYVNAVINVNTIKDGVEIDKMEISMEQEEKSIELTYADEGSYTTSLYGIDGIGNESDNVSIRYVIDKKAPIMDIYQVENGIKSEIEENQLFSVTDNRLLRFAVEDSYHNIDSYTIRIDRKTDAVASTTTTILKGNDISWRLGENASEIYFESDSLFYKEGQYTVTMTGKDLAGNTATKKKVSFYIDSTAPIITQRSALVNGAIYGENVQFQYDIYEFNYEGVIAQLQVKHTLDGVTQTTTQTLELEKIRTSFEYICSKQGHYTIMITAKDKAGNEAVQANASQMGYSISFIVDKEASGLSFTGVENNHKTTQPVSLTLQGTDRNHNFNQYRIQVSRWDREEELESFVIDGNKKTSYDVGTGWDTTGYSTEGQNLYQTSRTLRFEKEGIYRITFAGEDKAENGSKERTINFTIDKTAPVISNVTYSDADGILTERYQSIFSNKAILVEFQVEDQVVGVDDQKVYITVGDLEDRNADTKLYVAHKSVGKQYYVYIPTDLKVSEFDDTVTIWANDKLDNERYVVSSRIVYRTAKPTIQMNCDVDYEKWTNKNVTFRTTVTDNVAGLKEVVYKANGKIIKKVSFNKLTHSYSYDVVATDEATKVTGYAVTVEVTNNSGTTKTVKRQVYIDKTKPSVTLSGVNNGNHYRTNQSIITNVSDVSYENTKTVYYITRELDGKKTVMSMASFLSDQYDDSCKRKLLREGQYRVYAITTDSAGNKKKSNTLSFVIDKTAPEVKVSGVADGTMSANAVTLEFTCVESFYETNEVEIEVERTLDETTTTSRVDGFPRNKKATSMQQTFSEDGTYKVTIRAEDKAGNTAAAQTLTFSVDATKPIIRITGTENYQMWSNPTNVQFSVEESYYADNEVTITGTRQDVDGNVEVVELPQISNISKVSSLSQLFSEDGVYEFVMTAKDKAGNQDSQSIHFTIDQTKPEVKELAKYNGGYYQSFRLAESMNDVFRDLTVVSYRMLLNGVEYNGTDEITQEGKYNLYVEVTDELGHSNIQNIEFLVDHTPPKVIFSGVKDGELVEEEGVVSLTLTNADDVITGIRMNGVDYATDTRNLAYTEYGSYRVEVDCEDKAGNKVTRELYFVYSNPMTIALVTIGMGILAIGMCIWLWVRTRRKEKEEMKL